MADGSFGQTREGPSERQIDAAIQQAERRLAQIQTQQSDPKFSNIYATLQIEYEAVQKQLQQFVTLKNEVVNLNATRTNIVTVAERFMVQNNIQIMHDIYARALQSARLLNDTIANRLNIMLYMTPYHELPKDASGVSHPEWIGTKFDRNLHYVNSKTLEQWTDPNEGLTVQNEKAILRDFSFASGQVFNSALTRYKKMLDEDADFGGAEAGALRRLCNAVGVSFKTTYNQITERIERAKVVITDPSTHFPAKAAGILAVLIGEDRLFFKSMAISATAIYTAIPQISYVRAINQFISAFLPLHRHFPEEKKVWVVTQVVERLPAFVGRVQNKINTVHAGFTSAKQALNNVTATTTNFAASSSKKLMLELEISKPFLLTTCATLMVLTYAVVTSVFSFDDVQRFMTQLLVQGWSGIQYAWNATVSYARMAFGIAKTAAVKTKETYAVVEVAAKNWYYAVPLGNMSGIEQRYSVIAIMSHFKKQTGYYDAKRISMPVFTSSSAKTNFPVHSSSHARTIIGNITAFHAYLGYMADLARYTNAISGIVYLERDLLRRDKATMDLALRDRKTIQPIRDINHVAQLYYVNAYDVYAYDFVIKHMVSLIERITALNGSILLPGSKFDTAANAAAPVVASPQTPTSPTTVNNYFMGNTTAQIQAAATSATTAASAAAANPLFGPQPTARERFIAAWPKHLEELNKMEAELQDGLRRLINVCRHIKNYTATFGTDLANYITQNVDIANKGAYYRKYAVYDDDYNVNLKGFIDPHWEAEIVDLLNKVAADVPILRDDTTKLVNGLNDFRPYLHRLDMVESIPRVILLLSLLSKFRNAVASGATTTAEPITLEYKSLVDKYSAGGEKFIFQRFNLATTLLSRAFYETSIALNNSNIVSRSRDPLVSSMYQLASSLTYVGNASLNVDRPRDVQARYTRLLDFYIYAKLLKNYAIHLSAVIKADIFELENIMQQEYYQPDNKFSTKLAPLLKPSAVGAAGATIVTGTPSKKTHFSATKPQEVSSGTSLEEPDYYTRVNNYAKDLINEYGKIQSNDAKNLVAVCALIMQYIDTLDDVNQRIAQAMKVPRAESPPGFDKNGAQLNSERLRAETQIEDLLNRVNTLVDKIRMGPAHAPRIVVTTPYSKLVPSNEPNEPVAIAPTGPIAPTPNRPDPKRRLFSEASSSATQTPKT